MVVKVTGWKIGVVLFCLLVGNANAQGSRVTAALPPALIALRAAGYEALFNLDYTAARAKFSELRECAPQHPVGDLSLAVTTWMEYLYKTRRLQTTLYSQSGFYAGGTKSKGDAIDAGVDKAFRTYIAQAETQAKKLVNAAPKDADALYFLGAVYGVLAGYEASAGRKFMSALRNGSRSHDYQQQVIKLRPDAWDAYLTIGLYDYIVGALPGFVRFLVGIVGISGDKERGIRELRTTVERGLYNQHDATVILLAVYQREGRPQDALPLLEKMAAQYPRNYLLRLELASTLNRLNRSSEAKTIFAALLQNQATDAEDLIRYQYGEALALKRESLQAAEQFVAVAQVANADPDLITWSLLRAGQMFDLMGKRDLAIERYRQVLPRPNVYDSREQASRGLKKAFQSK